MATRSYTIGLPVVIDVHDDGTVKVTTYLGEAGEAITDMDGDHQEPGYDEDTRRRDAAQVEHVVDTYEDNQSITVSWSRLA